MFTAVMLGSVGLVAFLNWGNEPVAIPDVAFAKRGYAIVVLLGILAVGIPVAGLFVGGLAPRLRPPADAGGRACYPRRPENANVMSGT